MRFNDVGNTNISYHEIKGFRYENNNGSNIASFITLITDNETYNLVYNSYTDMTTDIKKLEFIIYSKEFSLIDSRYIEYKIFAITQGKIIKRRFDKRDASEDVYDEYIRKSEEYSFSEMIESGFDIKDLLDCTSAESGEDYDTLIFYTDGKIGLVEG